MYDYTDINRYIQAHTGVVDPDAEAQNLSSPSTSASPFSGW